MASAGERGRDVLVPTRTPEETQVHPRAIVETGAQLGPGCRIGPGAYVGASVELGSRVQVGTNAVLEGRTRIGDDVRIWPGAVIGGEPQDRAYDGAPTGVVIGRGCQIREMVTVNRATGEGSETIVGNDVMLMATSHVAHNCRIGDGAIVANGALLAGHVQVDENAFVSGNATVHQFVRIGSLAMIGGLSRVNRDVPPYGLLVGNQRLRGINRVGVQRAGLPDGVPQELSELYTLLRRAGTALAKAAPVLRERARSPHGFRLVEFLEAPSQRGFCRF